MVCMVLKIGKLLLYLEGSWCVPVEATMCWALTLAELSVRWLWDMLFVTVAKGRLWLVGWDDSALHWRRSCMVGSMVKGICGSLVGTMIAG
jgi:hypothetical protein